MLQSGDHHRSSGSDGLQVREGDRHGEPVVDVGLVSFLKEKKTLEISS
jgi:hypothetical protein